MLLSQAIFKRQATVSAAQLDEHWTKIHVPLLIPMFLHCGITHYAQIFGPLTTKDSSLTLTELHSGLEVDTTPSLMAVVSGDENVPKWLSSYFNQVVLEDEKNFVDHSEPLRILGPDTISGERVMLIEDGKVLIDVPEKAWETFRAYEKGEHGKIAVVF